MPLGDFEEIGACEDLSLTAMAKVLESQLPTNPDVEPEAAPPPPPPRPSDDEDKDEVPIVCGFKPDVDAFSESGAVASIDGGPVSARAKHFFLVI